MAVLPLTSVYVWLCIVYLVEAWNRATPWLFTDELELTQLSRSIAATGHAARRGSPHSFDSLYTYLTAPVWLIHDVAHGVLGRQVPRRLRDGVGRLPDVLPRAPRRRTRPGAVRRGGGCGDPVARVLLVHRRGDARVSVCGALLLPDREGAGRGRRARRPYGWAIAAVIASLIAPAVRGELVVDPDRAGVRARSSRSGRASWARRRRGRLVDRRLARRDHARVRRDLRDQRRSRATTRRSGTASRRTVQAPDRRAWATGPPGRSRSGSG